MHQKRATVAVCEMNEQDIIAELLQRLTDDVQELKKRVARLPTQGASDHRAEIERLTQAVKQSSQKAEVVDLRGIMSQLHSIEQTIRHKTEYRLSRYVKFGGYSYGVMVLALVGLAWYALDLKKDRDYFEKSYYKADWRVRYVRQANPKLFAYMEAAISKDAPKLTQWVLEQEEADEKRELAQQAAEHAKALSEQANELEGKGKKKK